jgi:tyrosinase
MNTLSNIHRRRFLQAAVGVAVGTVAGVVTPVRAQAPGGSVRKDIRDLSTDELAKYREAVRRLKVKGPQRPVWANGTISLPDVTTLDKTGYAYQSLIHTFNCPHRNWWFLPWHRAYLFTFEQILRAAVADFLPGVPLAIPYWNWTEQMTLPREFTENPGGNPLYDERRFSVPLTDEDVGPGTIQRTVDQAGTFAQFGSYSARAKRDEGGEGPFEQGPHDTVHGSIGGGDQDPSTWGTMSSTRTSAFDPIFWSHHANIDRLWNVWRGQAGHANPSYDEPCADQPGVVTWGGLVFNEFVDPQGTAMARTVRDFLEDAAVVGVIYKVYTPPIVLAQRSGAAEWSGPKVLELPAQRGSAPTWQLELNKPVTLTVPVPAEARDRLASAAHQPARPVAFQLQGVKPPTGFTGVRVRAFLNNPNADATTSYKDPTYIGYFAFFDASHPQAHEAPGHAAPYSFNLGPVLQRLGDRVKAGQPLTVTLVMVPKEPAAGQTGRLKPVGTAQFQGGKVVIGK